MVERYYLDGELIEGWGCSHCHWVYVLDDPADEYEISSTLKHDVNEVFEQHICAKYQK